MARWQPNCTIIKGFAFEDSKGKVKQYKKGKEYHLSGDAKDFAALNRCAVMIQSDEPEVTPVIEGANVQRPSGRFLQGILMTNIVDYDPYTGITETYHKDPMTGQVRINKSQDLQPFMDSNAIDRSSASSGWKGDFHKVASIPLLVVEMWTNELKAKGYSNPNPMAKENNVWLMAKLNSNDFLKLRTKEGNI